MKQSRVIWLVLLFAATLALYWPATGFEFVNYDDEDYVYQNPWVNQGLSLASAKWALTSTYAGNWHPLTWISHMVDCSLYGLSPGGHHFTNIFLHAVNAALLLVLLHRLTRKLWPSLVAASLFAWHPLHVQSVAWVAERKDVLSTFFLFLTLLGYAQYAARPNVGRYILALGLFALGLMCKPMIVTLPCLLLLLDYWPLNRGHGLPAKQNVKLLVEKLPFFALAAGACFITVVAQHAGGAIKSIQQVSFVLRSVNALAAYGWYLKATIWPAGLCAFHPLPGHPPLLAAAASVLVLSSISSLARSKRSGCPWLPVGWLWFLGTLVPVIGLIQVGGQAVAERYTYVPLIGVFVIFAWSLDSWVQHQPLARSWAVAIATGSLISCAIATECQLPHWRNGIALFSRVLEVNGGSSFAHNGLGVALSNAGQGLEAIDQYTQALDFEPNSVHANYNLGIELAAIGKLDDAERHFSEALLIEPTNESLQNNLGVVLARQGKLDAAIEHFRQAITNNPTYPKSYFNYAMALEKQGQFGLAATNYATALHLDPTSPEVLDKLANLYAAGFDPKWKKPSEAVALAERACRLTESKNPAFLATLAMAYASAGRYPDAVATAELAQREAQSSGLSDLAARLAKDLAIYRARQ